MLDNALTWTPALAELLLVTSICVAILMLAAWLVSLPLKNASIADIVWGSGFVLIAWAAFFTVNRPLDIRQALMVGIGILGPALVTAFISSQPRQS